MQFIAENIEINNEMRLKMGNKDLVAICGFYCGACSIYRATQDKNEEKLKEYEELYYALITPQKDLYGKYGPFIVPGDRAKLKELKDR